MTPDKTQYEVWRQVADGSWSTVSDDAGATRFDDLKKAERILDAQYNQGNVLKAALVQVRPLKVMNCVGISIRSRMDVRNVRFEGDGKFIAGPPIRRFGK